MKEIIMSDRKQTKRATGISWDELARREPRLLDVLNSVRAAKPTSKAERRRFNYEREWNDYRRWFEGLVGMYRNPPDPVLSSPEAWYAVFARLDRELYDK
jgi:hypothetical protein